MNIREENLNTLESIRSHTSESNWNCYDAKPIPDIVLSRSIDILNELNEDHQPNFIAPTGRSTIQFEYENDSVYLEFEIYTNHIEGYVSMSNFSDENLLGFNASCIKKYVDTFFKQ